MATETSWMRELRGAEREWQRGIGFVNDRVVPAVRASLVHVLRASGLELARLADTLDGWVPSRPSIPARPDFASDFRRDMQ